MPRESRDASKTLGNGATRGFEEKLWLAADKLRGQVDAAAYKHIVLGLIFLKYISDAFQERHALLQREPYADPEGRDEYAAAGVFWVPPEAVWLDSPQYPLSLLTVLGGALGFVWGLPLRSRSAVASDTSTGAT